VESWIRLRRASRFAVFALLVIVSCSWLALYLESIHHRRLAERLIAELRAFPFATAGFVEVRDLANRYGGNARQQFPLLKFLPPGIPIVDAKGQRQTPAPMRPNCTPQDCTFDISIKPFWYDFPLNYQAAVWLGSALAHSGVRPWVLQARFDIRGGKLESSVTTVGQLRRVRREFFEGVAPLEYDVISRAYSPDRFPNGDFRAGIPHISGGPVDILSVQLAQTPNAPIRRAFDIDLRCFTAVLRSCRGFSELAPSAWHEYQTQLKAVPKENGK